MKFEVQVQEKHISGGVRNCGDQCAIALALKEFPGVSDVAVYGDGVQVWFGEEPANKLMLSADLPEEAQDFINEFDAGDKVHPLKFTIELKEKS